MDQRTFQIIKYIWNSGYKAGIRDKNKRSRKSKRKAFSKQTKNIVLLLQGFHCRICGNYLDVKEFDHINGDKTNNLPSNCQALCPTCHRRKTRLDKFKNRIS